MKIVSPSENNVIEVKEKKPSLLLILLHLWGGICLKAYVEISGLFMIILTPLKGSDHSSASRYAGAAGLLTFVIVLAGYFLSSALVKRIDSSSLKKEGKSIVKLVLPAVYFIVFILLAMLTGPLFSSTDDKIKDISFSPESIEMAPVIALSVAQSSEGLTEEHLDQTILKQIESWTVNTIIEKSRSKYAEFGHDPNNFNPEITANSLYVTISGKKLAVIKLIMENNMRSITIMGVKGKDIHRVTCLRYSNHDIPVWSGECGNKVKEVFGVSTQP